MRGARQTGKTWLVRELAAQNHLDLIELNLERYPDYAGLFGVNDPEKILRNIAAQLGRPIEKRGVLLFLDEIQAAPELLSSLRWFREDMPELPVIAAGSLLEFALKKTTFSMPVGRVSYFYVEPLSFFEFVRASGNDGLYDMLNDATLHSSLPGPLHEKCLQMYRDYCRVGGMPEVASHWMDSEDFSGCYKLQRDLLATYRDDFHKYHGHIDVALLMKTVKSVSDQMGNKFMYAKVDPNTRAYLVKEALELLFDARLCNRVAHTAANGLPLGAESNPKFFKAVMVDTGLALAQLGMGAMQFRGDLAEHFVAQQLRAAQAPDMNPELFYWQKTGGQQGEIDHVFQVQDCIVPIEIKSGASGSMKSLHQFMHDKSLQVAVRLDTNPQSIMQVDLKTTRGDAVKYALVSLPIYLAERLPALIESYQP